MEWVLMPFLVFALPFGAVFGSVYLWLKRSKATRKRTPLTRDLLRAPGQSVEAKLEDMRLDMDGYLLGVFFAPSLLFSLYLSYGFYNHKSMPVFSVLIYFLLGCGVIAYCVVQILRLARTALNYRLGLEAEMAVGQELNQLLRHGYWVFHDLPAEKFNIDHVVVGPNGVFAVETKGRAKPDQKTDNSWKVRYDGKRLEFPGWTETKPLEQAERQAKWLQEWLSSAVGEPVGVRPVLALPGWFIERTSREGMPVLNGKNPEKVLSSLRQTPLPGKLIQQIVHQLDQRCRNVAAKAYAQT